ncbi:response regulator [Paenibacillus sp. HN-1]|uniref:response regulator n=1 Tax=Paenibacillus TaxID=44249 RepID=UPI001CAA10BC|nr:MULTISPECIES: response regulator [Paenibacillus]MBY9080633.1 response regulator [Paenibacillus sp. CGMCC 1.18879]MBY9085422.1 response regulator [Paenibacillus sinensis]
MLSILIVDDEVFIRDGLSRIIGRESGFRVAGSCSNGREALEFIGTEPVDVVLTDIRMPEIDGLALIRELRTEHPEIRCIIMSGFTEFSYAQEAIRYAAVDYLLKPIDKEQLLELLHRLDSEKSQAGAKEKQMRARLLDSCLHSDVFTEVLPPDFALPAPYFVVYVQKGDSSGTLKEGADNWRTTDETADCLPLGDRQLVWIAYFDREPGAAEIRSACSPLLSVSYGRAVHVGASRPGAGVSELKAVFSEAEKACELGIYSDAPVFFAWQGDLPSREEPGHRRAGGDWDALREDLQMLHISQIGEWVHQEFDLLKSRRAGMEDILQVCRSVLDTAATEFQELDSLLGRERVEQLERSLASAMSIGEIERQFRSVLEGTLEEIRKLRQEMGGNAVEHIKRWISANYSQHAELGTLAGMVYLTPSYLSKLFKQETGLTLTEYITEIRIRKAKQMLRSSPGMKVHKIGAEVGYPDPAYFNKLFKRMVGVTPNEYKKIRN